MQYLGGKSRIAKHIAPIVNAARTAQRPYFWDPFCGGLSMSVALAAGGPGYVTDANPALIALYQAVRDGWDPPETVSESEWRAARTLPDSDPRKAFAGFGCSFGGKWFAGYAGADQIQTYRKRGCAPQRMQVRPAAAARKALLRKVARLAGSVIAHRDFFAEEPCALPILIYADPPYAGTTGYTATEPFDHDLFWRLCRAWERCGVPVFVSEYACPVQHIVLWERDHTRYLGGGQARGAKHTDRLFRVTA